MLSTTTKKGQLCKGEREIIEYLWKNGKGKSCHFIGKECRKQANRKYIKLLQNRVMYTRFSELFKQCHEHWGVDEIVGFLRNNGEEMVCTSTVYHFIHWYKREREYWLRHGEYWYRKKKGKKRQHSLMFPG